MSINGPITCNCCRGTGEEKAPIFCEHCNGDGRFRGKLLSDGVMVEGWIQCSFCSGWGHILTICKFCNGYGRLFLKDEITLIVYGTKDAITRHVKDNISPI